MFLTPLALVVMALAFSQDPSVGAPEWRRNLVLAGSELEVKPSDIETPIVVRIADVRPHGDSFRYDIVYYGLDAGDYDLTDFLERKNGSSTDDLAEISITILSVLPPGQVVPNQPVPSALPRIGGYSVLIWGAGVLWIVGLWAILALGRKKKSDAEHGEEHARPRTLAERLRPLVEQAVGGNLSREDRAELELALIAFWRKKLELGDIGAAQAIAKLKGHDEAGPLLVQLEDWLHRPEPPQDIDVSALLAPYQSLPANALGPVAEAGKV